MKYRYITTINNNIPLRYTLIDLDAHPGIIIIPSCHTHTLLLNISNCILNHYVLLPASIRRATQSDFGFPEMLPEALSRFQGTGKAGYNPYYK